MELRGDGVKALREYLEDHGHKQQPQDQDHDGELDAMTAPEFRAAVEALAHLRKTSPETPHVTAFLTHGSGMRVRPVVETAAASDGEHEDRMRKRRQKLLRLEEEEHYRRLVKNVQPQNATHELQRHVTSAKHHLSIGANMIAARITAFVAGYMIARALTPNETTVGHCPSSWFLV